MEEDRFEVEEVKEAIKFIGEYCINCCNCDNCDKEIKEWCDRSLPVTEAPCEWNSFEI